MIGFADGQILIESETDSYIYRLYFLPVLSFFRTRASNLEKSSTKNRPFIFTQP